MRRLIFGALLLAACGADSITSLPEDEFPEAFAEAECTDTSGCCAKAGYAHADPECFARSREYTRKAAAAAKAAHAIYDGTAAFLCVHDLRAAVDACKSMKEENPITVYAGACARVYRGTKPLSASCEGNWECSAPAGAEGVCDPFQNYVCGATITVGLGERAGPSGMTGISRRCAPDLFTRADDLRCVGRLPLGADCLALARTYGDVCEAGALCDAANTGKCVKALPVGAECRDGWQCEVQACRHGRCAVPQNALGCVDDDDADAAR